MVSLTKSRKIPTRKMLPLFFEFVIRATPTDAAYRHATGLGIEAQMARIKALWAVNSPNSFGQVALSSLEISLMAGNMPPERVDSIIGHFCDQGLDQLDFLCVHVHCLICACGGSRGSVAGSFGAISCAGGTKLYAACAWFM